MHDLLEGVSVFDAGLLLTCLVGYKENDSTDNIRTDSPASVDDFLTLLHLVANISDQLRVPCSRIVFKIFSQIHERQIVIIVAEDPRVLFDFT